MMHAANNLLNSVTKVLLLADIVVVNRILKSKNKVVYLFWLVYALDFEFNFDNLI